MDRIERLHKAKKRLKDAADKLSDQCAMEIAREVEAGPRGTESEIARRLGITQPAVSQAAKKGRALLAKAGAATVQAA